MELMIVIAIIAVLLSVLLPALSRPIGAARGFRGMGSLRIIAFDFSVFPDDLLHGDLGSGVGWGNGEAPGADVLFNGGRVRLGDQQGAVFPAGAGGVRLCLEREGGHQSQYQGQRK